MSHSKTRSANVYLPIIHPAIICTIRQRSSLIGYECHVWIATFILKNNRTLKTSKCKYKLLTITYIQNFIGRSVRHTLLPDGDNLCAQNSDINRCVLVACVCLFT